MGVIGFVDSGFFKNPKLKQIFRPGATVFAETAKYIFPLKLEQREELKKQLVELAVANNQFKLADYQKDHHLKFNVSVPQ